MRVTEMEAAGISIIRGEAAALSETGDEKAKKKKLELVSGEMHGDYDEVLFSIGRTPVTDTLDLPAANVETMPNGVIKVDAAQRTTADGVYAVGDVIGKVDLTPVAIAAGRLLADRLFAGVSEKETTMDYDFVPTVVFSHPPRAVMGFTEAQAREKYGDDEVTVHKSTWGNMMYSREFLVEGQFMPKTMAKLVCVGEQQKIVGLHMIGLATDEILQVKRLFTHPFLPHVRARLPH